MSQRRETTTGIRVGNVTVNGEKTAGVVINGDTQLKCPCGNTSNWGDITMTNNRTVADCGDCGEQMTA
jgi:hypothetical protein